MRNFVKKAHKKNVAAMMTAVAVLLFVCVMTAAGCIANVGASEETFITNEGDSYQLLYYMDRQNPQLMDAECERYPVYDNKKSFTQQESDAIIDENKRVIDDTKNAIKENRLQKHPAADGQFGGVIDDKAPAVAKKVTINPKITLQRSLGVYAAPGEVVTIRVDESFTKLNMLNVCIGYFGQKANMNDFKKTVKRLPVLAINFSFETHELKVGSPYGGNVYLSIGDYNGDPFDVTTFGGVESGVYTYGVTTDAEFERMKSLPGLYAEMRTSFLRFLIPKAALQKIDDAKPIMKFWQQAANLSANFMRDAGRVKAVTMSFDYYVPAGAAVAFVGAWFCCLPTEWASSSLNYSSMVASGGWGSLHEFNHHFQGVYRPGGGWGMSGGGEVTNNVLNAITYSLYTDIALARSENGGLSGWNYVADPYYTFAPLAKGNDMNNMLRMYITLYHSFGVKNFNNFVNSYYDYQKDLPQGVDRGSADAFCYFASRSFGYDMTYYVQDVLKLELSDDMKTIVSQMGLTKYVPVFNLYAMGVAGVNTGRPFVIAAGEEHVFRFREFMACPTDEYTITVKGFKKGKLTALGNDEYRYSPSSNVKDLDDFQLIVRFKDGSSVVMDGIVIQNPNVIQGERYDNVSGNLDELIASESYLSAESESIKSTFPGVPNYNLKTEKSTRSLAIVEGKLIPDVSGEYTIYMKADDMAKLYFSMSGKAEDAVLVSEVKSYRSNYDRNDSLSYFTVTLQANEVYYFKIYNLNNGGQGGARLGWSLKNSIDNEGSSPIEDDGSGGEANKKETPIVDIPTSQMFHLSADKNSKIKRTFISNFEYTRPIRADKQTALLDKSGMKMLAAPTPSNADADMQVMLDSNKATFYHTNYSKNNAPAFPHDYDVDLGGEYYINSVSVAFRRASTDAFGDYEIYYAKELGEWIKVTEGKNSGSPLRATFDSLEARYIRIRALNNANGNIYTVVSEIDFYSSILPETFLPHNSSLISYRGNFTIDRSGAYANGAAIKGSGVAEIKFHGNAIGIYSKLSKEFGKGYVSLDGGQWQPIDLSSEYSQYQKLIFAATGLENKEHILKFKSADNDTLINIDFIAAVLTPQPHSLWWVWLIVSIVIVAIVAALIFVSIKFKPWQYMKRK